MAVLGLLGCGSGSTESGAKVKASSTPTAPSRPPNTTSVNDFLAQGDLTFVRGTLGDEASDRAIAAQIGFMQPILGNAPAVDDTTIDVTRPESWPRHPVLYGGPHVHATLAALGDALPFAMKTGSLRLGDATFSGDQYRMITVVPARDGERGWPEFLLYAGTGTPGIGEINDVTHGPDPLLVADAFGSLRTGTWTDDGVWLSPAARRIEWRSHSLPLRGTATVDVRFPGMLEATEDESMVVDAVLVGLTEVLDTLNIAEPVSITVYVHPDVRSKIQLSGKGGDGHAVAASRAIHVLRAEPKLLQSLVAHEGTHVLAYHALGAPATSFMGEGLAVWVANGYGGRSLHDWESAVTKTVERRTLVGPGFRTATESEAYPYAGLFVRAAVHTIGLEKVRDHLLPASAQTWDAALAAAGTSHEALEAAVTSADLH